MLECLFHNVEGLTYSNTSIFCDYCKIFKDTYDEEHLPIAASAYQKKRLSTITNIFYDNLDIEKVIR